MAGEVWNTPIQKCVVSVRAITWEEELVMKLVTESEEYEIRSPSVLAIRAFDEALPIAWRSPTETKSATVIDRSSDWLQAIDPTGRTLDYICGKTPAVYSLIAEDRIVEFISLTEPTVTRIIGDG